MHSARKKLIAGGAAIATVALTGVGVINAAPAQAKTFVFDAPGVHEFVVPGGATKMRVDVYGAQGGRARDTNNQLTGEGGTGGFIKATFNVSAGNRFILTVGERGGTPAGGRSAESSQHSGIPGSENNVTGGAGGTTTARGIGGGGGGASWVRQLNSVGGLSDRLLVAGGGGGAGAPNPSISLSPLDGGAGSGANGSSGGDGGRTGSGSAGGGASGTSGGSGGVGNVASGVTPTGGIGAAGKGGAGGTNTDGAYPGGGGGGGYYGGGGGGGGDASGGGGGGGSGYADPTLSGVTRATGEQFGDGLIVITTGPDLPSSTTTSTTSTTVVRTITVTAPNGGENWPRNTVRRITWTTNNISGGNVRIQLQKGSTIVSTIVTVAAAQASYDWTLPASLTAGTDYKIKITYLGTTGVKDLSNAKFTIT